MNKENQIADMSQIITNVCETKKIISSYKIAETIYGKGYRKASEVAREIFAEIDNLLYQDERDYDDLMDSEVVAEIYQEYLACSNYICGARKAIAELKKKYTEEK